MSILDLAAVILSMAAVFSYINHRYIGLPTTLGVMLIAIAASGVLALLGVLGLAGLRVYATSLLARIDFNTALMEGMLSFLLFAGALHVNLNDLARHRGLIAVLATVGLVLSTAIVGGVTWLVFGALGVELSLAYCLVFGALIAPTDPIAVLAILKKAGVSKSIETKITGESLFNDGVAVVVFLVLIDIAGSGHGVDMAHVAWLFIHEAFGGALFGLAVGWLVYRMLRSVDNYQVEVLLTLALVMGGYSLASVLHVSGPIAMVVAGLLIGNRGRMFAMSDTTREHLDSFWELTDEILNAVLFVLIGLEMLVISMTGTYLAAGLVAIPIVLFARFVSVGVPVSLMRSFKVFSPRAVRIMTWGGLRGGISVALALSIPDGAERDAIVPITYLVVLFSILVQGLTIGRVASRA